MARRNPATQRLAIGAFRPSKDRALTELLRQRRLEPDNKKHIAFIKSRFDPALKAMLRRNKISPNDAARRFIQQQTDPLPSSHPASINYRASNPTASFRGGAEDRIPLMPASLRFRKRMAPGV